MTFTKTGWLGLCPVYFEEENIDGAVIEARPPWLNWWLRVNTILIMIAAVFVSCVTQKPIMFAIRGVQDLETPVTFEDPNGDPK